MRRFHLTLPLLGALLLPTTSLSGQALDKDALIKSALAAAPANIAKDAAVMAPGPDGKMVQLKAGTNGFTCMPSQPDGDDAMCLDPQAMNWAQSWMAHDPAPKNTAPGIGYMLTGGTIFSATDPWAKPEPGRKYPKAPPHWMILSAFDPKTSGLSATPQQHGTWIMFAGTPYAHLMINQVP